MIASCQILLYSSFFRSHEHAILSIAVHGASSVCFCSLLPFCSRLSSCILPRLGWIFVLYSSADVISASIMFLIFCQLLFIWCMSDLVHHWVWMIIRKIWWTCGALLWWILPKQFSQQQKYIIKQMLTRVQRGVMRYNSAGHRISVTRFEFLPPPGSKTV